MKKVNVGLIGAGTIGKGVADLLISNGNLIAERTGLELTLKSVCDKDKKCLDAITENKGLLKTQNADDILNDPEIDIVIELIGGISPAKEFIIKALKGNKHVVTANKALLSGSWKEIFKVAAENKVFVNFEASVGGGIPIIRAMKESYVSNNIELIYGILNGTTNFILTMMAKKDCSFEEALKVAQEKGIAESDPGLDISGKDSAHKLAILALLGFGIEISPDDIFTEGIAGITSQDIKSAKDWGYAIKLLAIAKNSDKGLQIRVHPTLIPEYHLLASVKGEDNAIFVRGDFVGESLLYGKGAGSKPTATSVLGDVVEIAKNVAFYNGENICGYNLQYDDSGINIVNAGDIVIPYYLRFSVIDKPGVLAGISSVLSKNNISIASMTQEDRRERKVVPVIMLTHNAIEGDMRKAIDEINKMDFVADKTVVIRMEG